MTRAYHVAIPSYGRADRVRALDLFPEATVYVGERQALTYEAMIGPRVVAVPNEVEGNLARKLNWILEHCIAQGHENVLRVDDDVFAVGMWELGEHFVLSGDEVDALVSDGFRMAREASTVFWGINILQDRRAYSVMRPIHLLAPVLGPWGGHVLDHGLRYDEQMGAKEDYDLFLQVIEKYRKVLRLDKYHYIKKEETRGGWSLSRTAENELEWARRIEAKWGRKVIKYDPNKKNLLDGRVTIPIPGC
jgi:hypothetical protein